MRNINNKSQKELVACFLLALLVFSIAALGAVHSKEDISVAENRSLAKKPEISRNSYFSGSFYKGWEEYITDHIPYRILLLGIAENLKNFKGIKPEVRIVEIPSDFGINNNGENNAPNEANGNNDANNSEAMQDLLIVSDRLIELYRFDQKLCGRYAAVLNEAAMHIPENVNYYSMIVPTRIAYEEEAYKKLSDSQYEAIAWIGSNLDRRIIQVDVNRYLEKHKDEYIYFRTDHHWTALGAYYGLLSFAGAAGIEPVDIKRYKEVSTDGFLGALYQMAPEPALKNNPDTLKYYVLEQKNNKTVVYFYDNNNKKSYNGTIFDIASFKQKSYGVFLGGDFPMIKINGNIKNGRILVLVKDSFGNAFAPWLTPYFESIIVIDPRHFKEDFYKLLTENGVTDVLVLNYMQLTKQEEYMELLNRFFDSKRIKVLVNGKELYFDQPPILENERTLVPLRIIFEALGATVDWNEETKTIVAVNNDIVITLKIGSDILMKNGERIKIDSPAKIVSGRTMVPIRAVAEGFGAEVNWNQDLQTIIITTI